MGGTEKNYYPEADVGGKGLEGPGVSVEENNVDIEKLTKGLGKYEKEITVTEEQAEVIIGRTNIWRDLEFVETASEVRSNREDLLRKCVLIMLLEEDEETEVLKDIVYRIVPAEVLRVLYRRLPRKGKRKLHEEIMRYRIKKK
jgi:predicted RNA methylase